MRISSLHPYFFAYVLCLFLPIVSWATPSETDTITPPAKGLLWKIEKPNGETSYLFGTIHSEDARVLDLSSEVKKAFADSQRLILEMRLDDVDMLALIETLYLPKDKNLAVMLGKEDFQRLFTALSQHGIVINMAMRLKPWVAMTILSFPKSQGGEYLDLHLENQAKARDIPVYGLETMDEQLAVFEHFSLDEQLMMLRSSLNELEHMAKYLEQLHQLYLARDLQGMQDLSQQLMSSQNPQEQALLDKLWQRLLNDRNQLMLKRMQSHLQAGQAFIAVGAMHLADSEGLVVLLQQEGYQVSRLY